MSNSTRGKESEHSSSGSQSTRTESTSTETPAPASFERGQVTHEYRALGTELIPAIGIRVRGLDGTWQPETLALVDSGADVSAFPATWASSLGVTLDPSCCEEKEAMTAAGPTVIWAYKPGLQVAVEGVAHLLKADFCSGLDVPLLGRRDFFDKYRISFDQRAKTFTLEPYGPRNWSETGP